MTLGEKIRRARIGMPGRVSQETFAEMIGRDRTTVSKYENDREPVPTEVLEIIAEKTQKPLAWFSSENPRYINNVASLNEVDLSSDSVEIPYWGEVPAGDWQEPFGDEGRTMKIDKSLAKEGRISVRIAGDSMSPKLEHGDLVIIQRSKTPREGVITLARNDRNELTLKVLKHNSEGEWELQSINPNHQGAKATSWEILGFAVSVQRTDELGLRP